MDLCEIGATNCVRNIPNAEVGYKIKQFVQAWEDPGVESDVTTDRDGTPIGFYARAKRQSRITLNGQPCGDVSALPFQFPCAGTIVVANLIDGYDISSGGVYMSSFTLTFGENADAQLAVAALRRPHIA